MVQCYSNQSFGQAEYMVFSTGFRINVGSILNFFNSVNDILGSYIKINKCTNINIFLHKTQKFLYYFEEVLLLNSHDILLTRV